MRQPTKQNSCLAGLSLAASLSIQTAALAAAAEQNWPQWRGPLQNGVAPTADPPIAWSETKNIKWKVKIPGDGTATPIVWGNQIFVQTAVPAGKKVETQKEESGARSQDSGSAVSSPGAAGNGSESKGSDRGGSNGGPPSGGGPRGRGPGGFGGGQKPAQVEQFVVLCLDRQTGKVLWQQVAREEVPHEGFREGDGSYASPSGLTDGEHVYAYFGSRGLYCYDLQGKLKWGKDLGKMRIAMGFGEGSSPAIYQDTLIVNWDNEDGSFITALNKQTGETHWKESRDEHTSWSTPLVLERDGKAQAVVSATGKVRSYDVATGKVLWECGGLTRNVIPTPVADKEKVYCTSGFMGNALLAIRLGGSGDLTGSDAIAWTHSKSTPYVPSPLLYGDKLYFFAKNDGIVSCLETKSGKALFDTERLEDLKGAYASPLGASGRVYLVGRNGATVVLKQSDKLETLATNKLEEKFDASPVAVGNELFLRGRQYLYCIAEK
jgi:outer membrane protein assembly factor BamB